MVQTCCCRFKLKALPGHSKAGQKVTYGVLKGAKFKQLALVTLLCLILHMKLYKSYTFSVVSTSIHAKAWSYYVQQAADNSWYLYPHAWAAAAARLVCLAYCHWSLLSKVVLNALCRCHRQSVALSLLTLWQTATFMGSNLWHHCMLHRVVKMLLMPMCMVACACMCSQERQPV